jgi:hypothetical protein
VLKSGQPTTAYLYAGQILDEISHQNWQCRHDFLLFYIPMLFDVRVVVAALPATTIMRDTVATAIGRQSYYVIVSLWDQSNLSDDVYVN